MKKITQNTAHLIRKFNEDRRSIAQRADIYKLDNTAFNNGLGWCKKHDSYEPIERFNKATTGYQWNCRYDEPVSVEIVRPEPSGELERIRKKHRNKANKVMIIILAAIVAIGAIAINI